MSELFPHPVDESLAVAIQIPDHSAMSNVDGCPECVRNVEPPRSAVPVDQGWRCAYLCSSCGHAWTTDWRE